MNWNWKKSFKLNGMKLLSHMGIEYSAIGAFYIALEGDPVFWIYGIATGLFIHLVVFTKIDFLHELHHHHKGLKVGHEDHKDGKSKSDYDGKSGVGHCSITDYDLKSYSENTDKS